MTTPIEVWLRGPVPGIAPLLQPAAHALLQVSEDVLPVVAGLAADQLWARPGGAASIGFHLKHLPGSLDRLLTYARGEQLSSSQMAYLASERTVHDDRPPLDSLVAILSEGIDAAIGFLRALRESSLLEPREVAGRSAPPPHSA